MKHVLNHDHMGDTIGSKNKRRDYFPEIPTNGKVIPKNPMEIKLCMHPESYGDLPETPKKLKKFSKAEFREPGETVVHYGIAEDEIPQIRFGSRNEYNDFASERVNPPSKSAVKEYFDKKKEETYKLHSNQPLGRTLCRNYQFPPQVNDSDFKFGVKTIGSENAKELIFPKDIFHVTESDHQQYLKSHGDYLPGEQKKWDYNWNNTKVKDPTKHRFGKEPISEVGGAKACLTPSTIDKHSGFNDEPAIVSNIVRNHNTFSRDVVGKTRPSELQFSPDYVFGKPTYEDVDGVAGCIKGYYSPKDQLPDKDLGKSITPGFRNIPEKEDRVYGVPTVRYDIKEKTKPCVTNIQNHGNEPDAKASLYPSKYTSSGLFEKDFDTILPKEELKQIVLASGVVPDAEEFELIYEHSQQNYKDEITLVKNRDKTSEDGMSVDIFRKSLNEVMIKRLSN